MDFFYWIFALILGGIGIASIAIPEDMIYMQNFFRPFDIELTEASIRWKRIQGVIAVIFAVIFIIIALI